MPRRETRQQRKAREEREARLLADRRRQWTVRLSDGEELSLRAEVQGGAACGAMQRDITLSVLAANTAGESADAEEQVQRQWEVPLYNGCLWPPCGSSNSYTWTEGARNDVLEIALDGTALHVWTGAMVLFVNGREIGSGRSKNEYWRRQFARKLLVGLALIVIGGGSLGIMFGTGIGLISMVGMLLPFGLFYFFLGFVGLLRFSGRSQQSHGQQSESERLLGNAAGGMTQSVQAHYPEA